MSQFSPYNHLGFLTNRIARLINQHIEPFMLENGYHFPTSCLGILADLWVKDGLQQKELGSSLIKNKSSINKMLHSLEKADMIVKIADSTDHRSKRIFLTERGKKLKNHISEKSQQMDELFLSEIPKEQIEVTKTVLTKMYHSLSSIKQAKLIQS